MPGAPSSATASASANSAFGPPLPSPRRVTVHSPPESSSTGASPGRRPVRMSRARRAWSAATSRASPSIASPSRRTVQPAAAAELRPPPQRLGRGGDHPVLGAREPRRVRGPGRRSSPASTASTEAGTAIRQRSRMARASAGVVVSPSGRAGGDEGGIVAGHVGDDQRQHPRRPCRRGELAALHPRQVLSHGVHCVDRRARGEERVVDGALLVERDRAGGLDEQRRAAAGDQRQHEVVLAEAVEQAAACARSPRARARQAPDATPRRSRCPGTGGRSRRG